MPANQPRRFLRRCGNIFEDINFGGMAASCRAREERFFEFPMPLMGWREMDERSAGKVLVVNRRAENERNARYAHVTVKRYGAASASANEGFAGSVTGKMLPGDFPSGQGAGRKDHHTGGDQLFR